MIAQEKYEQDEDAGVKSGRRHMRTLLQDCTAALKVTEPNWDQLNTGAGSPLHAHWFVFTQLAFQTEFQRRGSLPLPSEMTSLTVCSHQNKLCFS